MNITSPQFALFLLATLVVYYFLNRRAQNIWLLIVSYVFVITWDWRFSLVLLFLTIANYILGMRVRIPEGGRRSVLWFGFAINATILIFFRSANFFLPEFQALLNRIGISSPSEGLAILLPVGLSYYVLENISYLVDVSRGQLKAETDLVDYALYMAYFPKLIAGPIERARTFLPKLASKRVVDNQALGRSITLIVVGIVRKLLIADILSAAILSDVFQFPGKYTPPELVGWIVIYAFSLYNDFAGYTNIVRGVSGLFGIELSANFRQPYFARNFTEFWNRWHITLSNWLRDYIYFPLSRALIRRNPSRRNLANLILPPMATMVVSGLWHGFGVNTLVWGGLHGFYLVIERILNLWRPADPARSRKPIRQLVSSAVIFSLVLFAWVPFRWELPAAIELWRGLLNFSSLAMRYRRMFLVAPLIGGSIGLDWIQYRGGDEFVFLRWPRVARAFGLAVVMFFLFIMTAGDGGEPFIYQGF